MGKNKILIIEDDIDLRRALNIRLRANNYDTVFAGDGIMALSVARKEHPDLVLLDIGLPGGDGFVVMERMKNIADLACIPVVVLTARDPYGNKEKAMELGAAAFLQKPIEDSELLRAINSALGNNALSEPVA